jgi:hypothetical protein
MKKTFGVYYEVELNFGHVADEPNFGHELPKVEALHITHKFVKSVEAEDLEDVFYQMQGERWSPNGEARELIRSLGLSHTSMSVGDVIEDENGHFFMVDMIGFSELSIR